MFVGWIGGSGYVDGNGRQAGVDRMTGSLEGAPGAMPRESRGETARLTRRMTPNVHRRFAGKSQSDGNHATRPDTTWPKSPIRKNHPHCGSPFMKLRHLLLAATLTTALVALPLVSAVRADDNDGASDRHAIKHVVVIFQENVSFDHYFGTYPKALNPAGEPAFNAKPGTPSVNGFTDGLLNSNPNLTNPFRLGRTQVATCDQDHNYTDEQKAFDGGLMDMFVQKVGNGGGGCDPKQVMAYFDGNVVTALWNYAQNFAMSDNSFNTTFGPSTPGALNLISGQTHGASGPSTEIANGSVIGDPQPSFDDCTTRDNVAMSGKNVGDLLNAKGLTWGFFQGGFKPTGVNTTTGKAVCGAFHIGSDGKKKGDYIPHPQPLQDYQQTANAHHLPPTSVAAIGSQDQANHQYDMSDFMAALDAGILPAVSYRQAPRDHDGHAGHSDPLAEQTSLLNVVHRPHHVPPRH